MFGIIVRGALMAILLISFIPMFLVACIMTSALYLHAGIVYGDWFSKEDWEELKELLKPLKEWIREFVLDY